MRKQDLGKQGLAALLLVVGLFYSHPALAHDAFGNGKSVWTGALHLLTMVDNNGAGISSAVGFKYDSLWFLNFGSSCGLGNPAHSPC